MSTMVERVARAICEASGETFDICPGIHMDAARAAIEAMMEPTEEMVKAGMDANPRGRTISDSDLTAIYRAMFQAALKESDNDRS